MLDFLKQTKEKVSEAMKELDYLSKENNIGSIEHQVNLALTKNDLAVAQKKLDILILLHSKKNIDPNKVVEEYFKQKSQSCDCKPESFEYRMFQSIFNELLN